MNSKFHKLQAEELIKKVNGMVASGNYGYGGQTVRGLLSLAQVHAALAGVPDEEEE